MAPWTRTTTERYGVVKWNFVGKGEKHLSLEVGDTVCIQEVCDGWYRGHLARNKAQQGVFPASVVHLKEVIIEKQGLICLQKFYAFVKFLCVCTTTEMRRCGEAYGMLRVKQVQRLMWELMEWRSQLLSGTLPSDEFKELKQKVTSKIDYGNKYVSGPGCSR
uniref:Dedicator of cytokinesis 2 n=1 Tax=Seriola dumerili TaxID=41447 RepID=A0A3B4UKS3_SERDU